ncbi:MAG: hypothetical protein CMB80_00970 [Flammeovirgaceae bacterium]|nr:hypothetical protein [Flammeovirgaceae bacterium]
MDASIDEEGNVTIKFNAWDEVLRGPDTIDCTNERVLCKWLSCKKCGHLHLVPTVRRSLYPPACLRCHAKEKKELLEQKG